MKILHTSDWRLGRPFYNNCRLMEQRAALLEVVNIANQQAVDVVLVSGNLIDAPSNPKAIGILCEALSCLANGKRSIVVVAGEKDDCKALRALIPFGERHGVYIVTAGNDLGYKDVKKAKFVDASADYVELVITTKKQSLSLFIVLPQNADKLIDTTMRISDSAAVKTDELKVALFGVPHERLDKENLYLLDDFAYAAFGGTDFYFSDPCVYSSGGIVDFDFDPLTDVTDNQRGVIVAEFDDDGLANVILHPLATPRTLSKVEVKDLSHADEALKSFTNSYIALNILSGESFDYQKYLELTQKHPRLIKVAFGGKIQSKDDTVSTIAKPNNKELFLEYAKKANLDTSIVDMFKTIVEGAK